MAGRQKQSPKPFEEMFGFAPIGICQVDVKGHIRMINSEFAWMLGYESPQKLKTHISDFVLELFLNQKRAEEFLFTLREADQVSRFRCRLKKRDGSFIWAQCYARVSRDDSGRVSGFYGYAVDIGNTVKTEASLKKANKKLMILSVVDDLTKIANRRKFDQCLETEWHRHLRNQKPLSVILCDIDFFKYYNDTYGHQAGDACLQQVAKAIEGSLGRTGDLAARYGGEEFGIVLPVTDAAGARTMAEKVRTAIWALNIDHEGSDIADRVTLSLGTGSLVPQTGQDAKTLIKIADKALYEAKEKGRNQSVIGRNTCRPVPPVSDRLSGAFPGTV